MVSTIKKMFTGETAGLHQAAFLLGFFALSSQMLALVRDKLLAATFGASASLDVYYASFRIPDFLFVTVGSLVSLTVLIPFLSNAYGKGDGEAKKLIDSVFTVFVAIISFIVLVGFFLVPYGIPLLFPGFESEEISLAVVLTRILLLSPLLLGISNILGGIGQSKNRFFAYAVSPVVYNLGIIVGILYIFPVWGIPGLAVGVVIGTLLHALVQVPGILHLGLLPRITLSPRMREVKNLLFVAFPRTITLSISHISIFFLISIASLMVKGSITIFSFAFNLQSVPLSIFGVSYSLAAFPTLSRFFASGQREQFVEKLLSSARHIAFWAISSTVLFIVLRAHIVRVVLGSGVFSWDDTKLTAATLALFSISLVFQSLVLLFVRALYASGITQKPFIISIVSGITVVLSGLGLSKIFVYSPEFRFLVEALFKVSDIPGAEVMMLALGFTIGSILDCVLLWYVLSKSWSGFTAPLLKTIYKVSASSICAGFAAYIVLSLLGPIVGLDTFFVVLLQAMIAGIVGLVVLFVVMTLLKGEEVKEIAFLFRRKIMRNKTISPDTGVV